MNKLIEELVSKISAETPKINEKIVKRIINKTLEGLGETIKNSSDDKVIVPKLGKFIKKDGEKQSRIIFVPFEAKKEK